MGKSGLGLMMIQDALINKKFLFEVRGKANKDTNIVDFYVVSKVVLDRETKYLYRRLLLDRIADQELTAVVHSDMAEKSCDNGRARNVDDADQGVDKEVSHEYNSWWVGSGYGSSDTNDDEDSIPSGSEDLTNESMLSDARYPCRRRRW
ncbi:hypothetical protein CASFOL_031867 [Castilleja foliolosa]|uniref:Uncharacterized protein n=1 Tax=Castilleja foliolosa TaxID=1961234 RepID=A0ABD3C1L2_9LAMI